MEVSHIILKFKYFFLYLIQSSSADGEFYSLKVVTTHILLQWIRVRNYQNEFFIIIDQSITGACRSQSCQFPFSFSPCTFRPIDKRCVSISVLLVSIELLINLSFRKNYIEESYSVDENITL